jgi:hypothetical protein
MARAALAARFRTTLMVDVDLVCGELLILRERDDGYRLANVRETVRVALLMKLLFPLVGHLSDPRAACPSRWNSLGGGGIARREASTADHATVAATRPESERLGSADARILYALGVAEALAQNIIFYIVPNDSVARDPEVPPAN